MKFRQLILSVVTLSMVAALVACSSNSSTPVVKPISVAFAAAPPASVAEGAVQAFTATVTNDSASAGVTWSVTCGSASCGSFDQTNTGSGAATNYTAPATIPSGGSVTIKAASVTDPTKSVTATVTITGASSLADGTYVFSLAGQDAVAGYLYYVAGAFTVSSGAVVTGEQDFSDYAYATLSDAITGGTVTTTADGNLQITLQTADTSVGVSGTETLNGTLVSGTRALINEFDASATSSGELDLQTGGGGSTGSYAFFLNGGDNPGCGTVAAGVVNVDGAGTISGTGSVLDFNDCGTTTMDAPIDASTVSAPDSLGRITISLDLTTSGLGGIGLVGYIVDANRVRLVENGNDPLDLFFGVTGGSAFTQAKTGTFASADVAGSSYVFGSNGQDSNGYLQVAGVVNLNADGSTATGFVNFNDLTFAPGVVQAPQAFTGSYTIDPTGRVTLTNLTDGAATFGFNLQLYIDGNGHGVTASMDSSDGVGGYAFLQTGSGSFTAGSFAGNYGLDTTGIDWNTFVENDSIGPANSDGVAVLTGTFDQNLLFGAQTADLTLTDGYALFDPSGVYTGTMTGLDTSFGTTDNFAYYVVDPTKAVTIQTDANQLTLGYFELQQ